MLRTSVPILQISPILANTRQYWLVTILINIIGSIDIKNHADLDDIIIYLDNNKIYKDYIEWVL